MFPLRSQLAGIEIILERIINYMRRKKETNVNFVWRYFCVEQCGAKHCGISATPGSI